MGTLGLLINARARLLVRDPDLEVRLRRLMREQGLVIRTTSQDEVGRAMAAFHEAGVELLGVLGGDGTVLFALSAALDLWGEQDLPCVALLRGGTINTLAGVLGIQGSPASLLEAVIRARQSGRPLRLREAPSIRVNELCGFTFGAALMGRFYDEYRRLDRIDRLSVAAFIARLVASSALGTAASRRMLRPVPARIQVDGRDAPGRSFTVIVASCLQYHGFGVRPTYRGSRQPGRFQVVASSLSPARLARRYPLMALGRRWVGGGQLDALAHEVRITFDRPRTCMVDAEVLELREVLIRTGPRVRVVAP